VIAALDASPRATVVLVGHTGVDHLRTVADVWRELPMDKSIIMQWWLENPTDIPDDVDGRVEWLYSWWARIDAWISQHKVAPGPTAVVEGVAAAPDLTAPPPV
jgi:hypothetical protein